MHPLIFQKLFLSWSFTIRAFFLHLLVFRLARINDFECPRDDPKGKTSVRIIKLFDQRLDEIRKRHDELSPQVSSSGSVSDEDENHAQATSRHSFVSTIRHTPSIYNADSSPTSANKADKILGIGMPDPALASRGEGKSQSRAAKWLRALGGKGNTKLGKKGEANSTLSSDQNTTSAEATHELDVDSDLADSSNDSIHGRDALGNAFSSRQTRRDLTADLDTNSAPTSIVTQNTESQNIGVTSMGENISTSMSFDLQNATPPMPGTEIGGTNCGSRSQTSSHRVSRAFSRRQSMLPTAAINFVHDGPESQEDAQHSLISLNSYDRKLHIYAVQSLREYEQTIQEHDDFFSSQPQDVGTPQVPRLPIQWPAMWSE